MPGVDFLLVRQRITMQDVLQLLQFEATAVRLPAAICEANLVHIRPRQHDLATGCNIIARIGNCCTSRVRLPSCDPPTKLLDAIRCEATPQVYPCELPKKHGQVRGHWCAG